MIHEGSPEDTQSLLKSYVEPSGVKEWWDAESGDDENAKRADIRGIFYICWKWYSANSYRRLIAQMLTYLCEVKQHKTIV